MRETSFIEQNKEKWSEFEDLLRRKSDDPDKLSELYIQITDDLSYSRTYYPNRSVRVYLNGLAQNLFYKIYTNKKSRLRNFIEFWQFDLPQIVFLHRKEMRLSFFVFLLAMGIGVLSSVMDDTFAAHILGDSYVRMTEENIASGDPMAVYKQQGEFDMAMGITLNNLRVAFITFIFGVFFAIGSLAVLIKNGVMVGTFQYYFYEQGLFTESFLTIWVHGTLEISAIIIAGASGIVMGKGLVFPGTYSRLHAFRVSARRGLKMLLGISPIIILAGIIEGFLTRYTDAPDIFRLTFILASLFFILAYFVWYPIHLSKNGKFKKMEAPKLPADDVPITEYRRIKKNGEVFLDSFSFLKQHTSKILGFTAASSLLYAGVALIEFIASGEIMRSVNVFDEFTSMFDQPTFHYYTTWYLEVLSMGLLSIFGVVLCYFLVRSSEGTHWRKPVNKKHFSNFFIKNIANVVLIVAVGSSLFFLPLWAILLLGIFVFPLLVLWLFTTQKEKIPFFQALGRAFSLASDSWGKIIGLSTIIMTVCGMLVMGVRSPLIGVYNYFISENLFADNIATNRFTIFVDSFLGFFVLNLCCALMIAGFSFLYFSLREIKEAESLKQRIPKIGEKSQVFGMEREMRYVKD